MTFSSKPLKVKTSMTDADTNPNLSIARDSEQFVPLGDEATRILA
jgi:hypothetical protein